MKFAKLFPPSVQDGRDETCAIGSGVFNVKDVVFSVLPEIAVPTVTWVDGGSALLFGTPSRAIAVVKICAITTEGMMRKRTVTSTYLVSITAESDRFLVRSEGLSNGDERTTSCLQQDI